MHPALAGRWARHSFIYMTGMTFSSFPPGGTAVVVGATGGIGAAFAEALESSSSFGRVIALSRSSEPGIDLADPASIERAATHLGEPDADIRLIVDATGFLHDETFAPEKSWSEIDLAHMEKAFTVNAFGPALLMKHMLPLLPGEGKSVFVSLSAKVGSIGDNGIGGWYSYRASKAALNQFIKTASVELKRRKKEAVIAALHPGTVDTKLSEPFAKSGLKVREPETAAADLLMVIDALRPEQSGGFFDYRGDELLW